MTGVLIVGAASLGTPASSLDVRLSTGKITGPAFTVGLTVFDGGPPFDAGDGPGLDLGPSNQIVREGNPVTYVVDIGVRDSPLSDVVIEMPVPRGFTLMSIPDYCAAGSGLEDIGLTCRAGNMGQGKHFTRTVTMTAGPRSTTDGLPIAVVVTADGGAVRVRSQEVAVRVSTTAGVCNPHGVNIPAPATPPDGPVVADGRIAGLVTSGPAESVTIEGTDQCAHAIVRSVTPVAGRFTFVGLLPGMYRVTVDGRAPAEVELSPGAMSVNGLTF
ncbi:hypothetical protein [Rhodococcus erythropolis]|uniref:hypothetical protein n=1 Tax=Rhodococcus erythropolis TaxID=1833 RepID=UPI002226D5FA|nr:hypothetical protein [Rhodococcus erythropolis]MCW2295511.1 hypothetical protein [Rhodococcus erythropolis]